MTIDLDKLERLEREATPGPWEWNGIAIEAGRTDVLAPGESDSFGYGTIHIAEEDKNLIAALRNAAPAMIAELRAARERIAELDAARAAVGEGWFSGGATLAEAIELKCRMLESYAAKAAAELEEVERLQKRVAELEGGSE